jgi:hypothetical protein
MTDDNLLELTRSAVPVPQLDRGMDPGVSGA